MNFIICRCNRRAHLAEEIVEDAWLRDRRDVLLAYAVEDAIGECLDLHRLLRHVWKTALELLFREEIQDIDGVRRGLEVTIDRAVATMKRGHDLVHGSASKDCAAEKAGELANAILDSEQIRVEIKQEWPKINPRMMANSISAYQNGECRPVEDWLRESQSTDAA